MPSKRGSDDVSRLADDPWGDGGPVPVFLACVEADVGVRSLVHTAQGGTMRGLLLGYAWLYTRSLSVAEREALAERLHAEPCPFDEDIFVVPAPHGCPDGTEAQ